MNLPDWLVQKLRNPPQAGAGVHAWLYDVSRHLHAHIEPAEIIARLKAATAWVGRRVTEREITDAVNNSAATAWRPRESDPEAQHHSPVARAAETERWPIYSEVARRCAIADARDHVASLADLWERSPIRPEDMTADDFLDVLFPGNPWLCCAAREPRDAKTKRRTDWEFQSGDCSFVVPSPMTKALGANLSGRPSPRCLANTGPRRFLIVEFDDGCGQDEHASVLWHLDRGSIATGGPRLCLAVHSGGKSLHGWFAVEGMTESDVRNWMSYAVLVGADHATFTRCQLVRMPVGTRANGSPQNVFYFDPCFIPSSSRSSASGSTPATLPQVRSASAQNAPHLSKSASAA